MKTICIDGKMYEFTEDEISIIVDRHQRRCSDWRKDKDGADASSKAALREFCLCLHGLAKLRKPVGV